MVDQAIPVLRVADVATSLAFYSRLGFVEEWTHRFGEGFPAFASVTRSEGGRLFLSEHAGDAAPESLVYLRVADVDRLAADLGLGVLEQPWAREVHVTDPDGNRLRVGAPTSE